MGGVFFAGAAVIGARACSFDSADTGPATPARPAITSTLITDNPHNALSAVVTFKTHAADLRSAS